MSLYKRGETWWVSITRGGVRIRQSAGTPNRQEAQAIHDRLAADLHRRARSGATLDDTFVLWLKAAPRSRNEQNAIKLFRKLFLDKPLHEITGIDISAALADKGPAHANRIANIIRAALNLAVEHGLLNRAPKIPRRKAPKGRLRWFTDAEWIKLRAQLAPHLRPAAEFALATGLRQANVLGLQWDQVDLRRKRVWIDSSETKSGKPIGVPLSGAALAALKSVNGPRQGYVFTYRGRPIDSPKTAWNAAIKRAGIAHATWHDLRHTWASRHVQAGTPLAVLKELGGWASMDMVMRYSHLAPGHLSAWADNAEKQIVATKEASGNG